MQKKIRRITIILAILLAASILGLVGIRLYQHFNPVTPTTVVVPDNLITPETESKTDSSVLPDEEQDVPFSEPETADADEDNSTSGTLESAGSQTETSVRPANAQDGTKADALSLHRRKAGDNVPFHVSNMFPGDMETKYYCIHVSHKDDVTVRFHSDIREGSEKLAEVLKCRITLLTTGEILYEGLMRDMPEALTHALPANAPTTSELYYEVTAYLETSVGNDYQAKDLAADFRWWVEETDSLIAPQTGDTFNLLLYVCIAAGVLVLFFFVGRKRREVETDD